MHVLITGAARGIGKAIAEIFARNGCDLFLTSLSSQSLEPTLAGLKAKYPSIKVEGNAYNIALAGEVKALVSNCLEFAVPDVLINNAGIFMPGNIADEAEGILQKQLDVNLLSAYHLSRGLLPKMRERKSGHIFNICSIASLKAYSQGGAYSISKYAMRGFSENLREELKADKIKVTTVFPGAVFTDSWGDFDNSAGRILMPDDVAQMVWSASQLSPQACVEEIVIRPVLGDL